MPLLRITLGRQARRSASIKADGKDVNILHPPIQIIQVLRRTLGSHYTILRNRASLVNTTLKNNSLRAAIIVLRTIQDAHLELHHVIEPVTCLLERRARARRYGRRERPSVGDLRLLLWWRRLRMAPSLRRADFDFGKKYRTHLWLRGLGFGNSRSRASIFTKSLFTANQTLRMNVFPTEHLLHCTLDITRLERNI
jgi:hypothetical protein